MEITKVNMLYELNQLKEFLFTLLIYILFFISLILYLVFFIPIGIVFASIEYVLNIIKGE